MNLLILTNNPNRASFRQRVLVHLDLLQRAGIQCKVVKLPESIWARRKLYKRAAEFEAVFLHKKMLNLLDAFHLRQYSKKIIYEFDDAVIYSDKNPDTTDSKRQKSFRRTVKLSNMVIAGNLYLANHARAFNQNVKVLPTGLDVSSYRQDIIKPNDGKVRLVWIGSKSTLGYLAEIKPALEEIGSHCDNVLLRIICDSFFDLRNIKVEKHKWSIETQVRDLITSDIGLAPLPDNRFTHGKCGFKVLQYSAAGLPVITSPVGVNAEYVRDNVNGLLANNNFEWTEKILLLVKDIELRKQMGQRGRSDVERFDIKILGQKLAELIKSSFEEQEK